MSKKYTPENAEQPYEKRPIYVTVREILREAHVHMARMGKAYKFSLGAKLAATAEDLAECVFLAYEERKDQQLKLRHIASIRLPLHRLLINYRIASDLQQVSRDGYVDQVARIVSVLRQREGWEAAAAKEAGQSTARHAASCGVPTSRAATPTR